MCNTSSNQFAAKSSDATSTKQSPLPRSRPSLAPGRWRVVPARNTVDYSSSSSPPLLLSYSFHTNPYLPVLTPYSFNSRARPFATFSVLFSSPPSSQYCTHSPRVKHHGSSGVRELGNHLTAGQMFAVDCLWIPNQTSLEGTNSRSGKPLSPRTCCKGSSQGKRWQPHLGVHGAIRAVLPVDARLAGTLVALVAGPALAAGRARRFKGPDRDGQERTSNLDQSRHARTTCTVARSIEWLESIRRMDRYEPCKSL